MNLSTTAMTDPAVAFWLGPLPVRWYALAYIAGLLLGWYYCRKLAQNIGLWTPQKPPSKIEIDDLVIYVTLGVVLGGRLGEVLFYRSDFYFAHPMEILKTWNGGMSFHGGLLGSLIAVAIFARIKKLNTFSLFDMCCTVVPVGLFLGRVANFVNGELWGREVPVGTPMYPDFPYAMFFPYAPGDAPRYPSQLYEAFSEGLLLFIVLAIGVRLFGFRRPGIQSGLFLIGYFIARTVCEQFREPEIGNWNIFGFNITQGQMLSVPMLVVGVAAIALALSGSTQTKAGKPA